MSPKKPARTLKTFLLWVAKSAHAVERIFDRIKYGHSGQSPITIHPYRGFGTRSRFFIKGRVLECKPVPPARKDDNLWDNLLNSFHRFESDEIQNARISVRFEETKLEVMTDEEGYFQTWLDVNIQPLPEMGGSNLQVTLPIELELLAPIRSRQDQIHFTGYVVIPESDCNVGIISDIDDTIVHTDATNPARTVWNLISTNAYTRKKVPGSAAFYRGLWRGASGDLSRPFFYVSTSPWNIYDALNHYMAINEFPQNPVLHLRDWGITQKELLPLEHEEHKIGFINILLELFPMMKFILIGDSSQQDPEIYANLALVHPDRVLAIYLRKISQNPEQETRIHRLRAKLARHKVPVILSESFIPMAENAASHGWVSQECIQAVSRQESG